VARIRLIGWARSSRGFVPALVVLAAGLWSSGCCTCRGQMLTPTPKPSPLTAAMKPLSHCGEERWAVKTLSDKKSPKITFAPVHPVSISDLNQLTPHCNPGKTLGRLFPEEFRVYRITGVVFYVDHEDDRDYHIAVREDDDEESPTVVVEVVEPKCNGAETSEFSERVEKAAEAFHLISPTMQTLVGKRITVEGVGFFDRAHDQIGLAESCIELHPVLSIALADN
jgi:hypothetical protein